MPPDIFLWVLLGGLVLMMVFSTRNAKKQRQSQQAKQEEAIQIGTSVRTFSGFYGTVVDIDGDAITLETPAGFETVWHRQAIQMAATPPFAVEEDEEESSIEIAPALEDVQKLEASDDPDTDKK